MADVMDFLFKLEQCLKQTTIRNKHAMIDCKIVPYFAKRPLDSIQSPDVRK